jgi:iron complex transport system substrate-binding protein
MRIPLILLLTTFTLFAQARRIVSTAPSITETLFALGLGPRVVGVTNYCHYPAEADTKARIGTYLNPDIEAILALHPDLVVVERMPNRLSEQLQRLHVRSIEVDHSSIEDVFTADDLIANAAGIPQAGRRLNDDLRHGIDQIRQKSAHAAKPSVVFVVGHLPGQLQGLVVAGAAGARSYFTEILEIAGATNVFSDTKLQYPQISLEDILGRNPDFVLEMSDPAKKQAIVQLWSREKSLRAVRTNHILTVPADVFEIPGPRVVEACRDLLQLLHPELGL